MNDLTPTFKAAELARCEREPVHVPASIQPHGALLALDPAELHVVHAGGDTATLLGARPETLLGGSVEHLLAAEHLARIRQLLALDQPITRPLHAFSIARADGVEIDAIAHQSSGLLLLEFEPRREPDPGDALALVETMNQHLQQAETVQGFCEAVATEIRAVLGFDRVAIYRFMPDGSGAVIAEARGAGVESFLGMHFPRSDFPSQARSRYLTNWIRMIPDVRYTPAPVVPALNPASGRPLDLSRSTIRSVSPLHRQYLANMGAVASMSLSMNLRGKPWGLIACHHRAPRYLPQRLRLTFELFAEIVSAQLEAKVAAEDFDARLRATNLHQELVTRMSQETELAEGLIRFLPNLIDFIPAAGVGLWVEGGFTGCGKTPSAEQMEALVVWLNATVSDGVFHTDCLPLLYPPAESYADAASGVLALSLSRTARDYVLWFRPEVITTVTWGGNPDTPMEAAPEGGILTPRTSFAAWQQSVRLHASPWLDVEVEAVHRLRVSLLEVVLRRIDQLARERESARQKQAQMMEELDRRLEQWQALAQELKQETERRALLEGELSQVLRRIVSDQEAERLRIARELHDTLGQSLTLLQLGLEGIGRSSPGNAEIQQRIGKLKGVAAEMGQEVNRLAWEIRPTALDDLGIQTAIRNLLETWSGRCNIPFDLHMTLDDRRVSSAIETTLYRVLQEALTNVARHAKASRVGVMLGVADEQVSMIIEDDGCGFGWDDANPTGPPSKRLGLLGMRERLSLVSGSLEIESAPGQGTTLFVRIPLSP